MEDLQVCRVIKELKTMEGNDKCFECGMLNPQWSSTSYGILICFNCAGKHRSLGTHLSVVRSLTMDKWNELNLSKLRVGGNQRAKEFFESQKDYQSKWSFQDKYNSLAAALLRDKVSCESEGKSWSAKSSKAKQCYPEFNFNRVDQAPEEVDSNAFLSYYGGTTDETQQTVPENLTFNTPRSGTRFEGFGNPAFQRQQGHSTLDDILNGIVRSLSAGWSAVKKFALSAFENTKDLKSQTKQHKTSKGSDEDSGLLAGYSFCSSGISRTKSNFCLGKIKHTDPDQEEEDDFDSNADAFYDAKEPEEDEKVKEVSEPVKLEVPTLSSKEAKSTNVKKSKAMNAKKLKLKKIEPAEQVDQADVPTLPSENVESQPTESVSNDVEEPKPKKKEFDDSAWGFLDD